MIKREDIQQDICLRRISGRRTLCVQTEMRYRQIDALRRGKCFRDRRYDMARREFARSEVAIIDDEELACKIMEKIPKTPRQRYILERLRDGESQVAIANELTISPAMIVAELRDIRRRSLRLVC